MEAAATAWLDAADVPVRRAAPAKKLFTAAATEKNVRDRPLHALSPYERQRLAEAHRWARRGRLHRAKAQLVGWHGKRASSLFSQHARTVNMAEIDFDIGCAHVRSVRSLVRATPTRHVLWHVSRSAGRCIWSGFHRQRSGFTPRTAP